MAGSNDGLVTARDYTQSGMSAPVAAVAGLARGLGWGRQLESARTAAVTIVPLDIDKAERLLNNIRRRNGAPPVALLPSLQTAAARHAASMARRGRLAHDFGHGTGLRDRLAHIEPHVMAAENVGAGFSSIESVLKGWMVSRGHWRTMADGRLTHFGLAQAVNPASRNRNYWALILIRSNFG